MRRPRRTPTRVRDRPTEVKARDDRSVPARLQETLEDLYGIETDLRVDDFVVQDAAAIDRISPALGAAARASGETLFVAHDDSGDEIAVTLYLDGGDLRSLTNARKRRLAAPWSPFLRVLEGVSHFVYLTWRAQAGQPVSALELELQAEVDKFAACVLPGGETDADALRHRLYALEDIREDLPGEARDRYRAAITMASLLASALERRYLRHGRRTEMLRALRRFYRLPRAEKIAACLAA